MKRPNKSQKKKNSNMSFTCQVLFTITLLLVNKTSMEVNPFCNTDCGNENIVCKNQPCFLEEDTCGKGSRMAELSEEERQILMKGHNEVRQKVANGSDYSSFGFYAEASDMQAISYSRELEFAAQCWANKCTFKQDPCRKTPNFDTVGQNIYGVTLFTINATTQKSILKNAVLYWYRFREYMSKEQIDKYKETKQTRPAAQILWSQTQWIGCGMVYANHLAYLVCNYGPGHIDGDPIYRKGKCDTNTCLRGTCNESYIALCGPSVMQDDEEFVKPFEINLGGKDKSNFEITYFMVVYSLVQIYYQ